MYHQHQVIVQKMYYHNYDVHYNVKEFSVDKKGNLQFPIDKKK